MILKMTNSLLSAYLWYRNSPLTWKLQATEALHDNILKKFTSSEAIIRGDTYEKKINEMLSTNQPFTNSFEKVFEELREAAQQRWIKKLSLETSKGTFIFRGRYDFKLNNRIYDLKTTSKEILEKKYTESMQHSIYCLAEDVEKFTYLIVRLGKRYHPLEVKRIDLTINLDEEREKLIKVVEDCVDDLKELNFWEDYVNIFNR